MNGPGSSPPSESGLKYAPGVGPRRRSDRERPLAPLEWVTLLHVGLLVVGVTWAFGGQADWVRLPIAWWASLSVLILLTAVQDRGAWREGHLHPLRWLWPLGAFNGLVLLACLNPSVRELSFGGETVLAHTGGWKWWPSSARPALAVEALWLFDALWLSAFNLAVVVRQRRALRGLVLVLVANALVLSVFGTVQKLAHAQGLYFDAVRSPQPRFFASFVYHNHWGAFTVLMMTACVGLTWHYSRRLQTRGLLHSPLLAGWVALLLLAATLPLSASRSCTLLGLFLLGFVSSHLLWRMIQRRRSYKESIALPVAGIAAGGLLVLGGGWYVGRDTIVARLQTTQSQVAEMRELGGIGDRALLYRNTWRMAAAKPWFGWGMASYPHVFYRFYNTRQSPDRLPVFYHDAHSDWLQALAEHGFLGSAFLALCALVPLARLGLRSSPGAFSGYLLVGCGLILLYAWVEFPFGNLAVVLTWWVLYFSAVQSARLRLREEGGGSATAGRREG
ncbi:MAG: O-antigen ligase family protein [Verrucomicrobia bacterium]|nr:O-antigen ligase family protein [Verrucomicrobiota bacterium]